jgi:hypothetical protein
LNVRHNLEGLSAVFPPAYLLSFVTDHATEPLRDAPDLPLYVRSRMTGVLGLCFRSDLLADTDSEVLSKQLRIYKSLRDTLRVAAASLLTGQATLDGGPAWDVLQSTAEGREDALISAFQSDEGVGTINVKPLGLDPAMTYQVQSVDSGILGSASGAALMSNGIDIVKSPASAAHILVIRAQQHQ